MEEKFVKSLEVKTPIAILKKYCKNYVKTNVVKNL